MNAASFNSAFENLDMVLSLLVKKVLVEVENDLTVSWVQGEDLRQDTLSIQFLETRLYAKIVDYPTWLLTITILNNPEDIKITVSELPGLRGLGGTVTREINLKFELYFDQYFEKYCTTLIGKVEYIHDSTNPDD